MEKFERNGVMFTVFEKDGIRYLCTGEPSGELKFEFVGEVCDYVTVVGATSVVSSKTKSLDELYQEWLLLTQFTREELGVEY